MRMHMTKKPRKNPPWGEGGGTGQGKPSQAKTGQAMVPAWLSARFGEWKLRMLWGSDCTRVEWRWACFAHEAARLGWLGRAGRGGEGVLWMADG